MQPRRQISISGLIIAAFLFMGVILVVSEDEKHYWMLLPLIPMLAFLIWDRVRKESTEVGD